ncbi:MAG TPA: hypothetical protein VGD17_16120, partial [Chitinophagaceae bacterium]
MSRPGLLAVTVDTRANNLVVTLGLKQKEISRYATQAMQIKEVGSFDKCIERSSKYKKFEDSSTVDNCIRKYRFLQLT